MLSHCFNYFIEFRPFGWSASVYERHIPKEKIFNLNYYPILDEFIPFAGLPKGTQGKVIIGAGGSTYKFQGSDFFYEAVNTILSSVDNAVLVFIGESSKQLINLSKQNHLKNKIYLLGYRKDFTAIMKNIDILLNSIPFSGGLFCQTAAYYSKPILSYSDDDVYKDNAVEDILGLAHNGEKITITSKTIFIKQAIKLIGDAEFRKKMGTYAFNIQQKEKTFNQELKSLLEGQSLTLHEFDIEKIDRTPRVMSYLKIKNENDPDQLLPIARKYGISILRFLRFSPLTIIANFRYIFHHVLAFYLRK